MSIAVCSRLLAGLSKPYEFKGFGAMDVTKPYEFIRFGAMDVTKPYEFIGFGAMDSDGQAYVLHARLPSSRLDGRWSPWRWRPRSDALLVHAPGGPRPL